MPPLSPVDRRLAAAILPGLVHFGFEPLRLAPMVAANRVRVLIADNEILNLDRILLTGPSSEAQSAATCTLTSIHRSSAPAAAALKGKPIHSEREPFPAWEAVFEDTQEIEGIEIGNRLGLWGGRSYALCVELSGPQGQTWRFDNCDREVMRDRLATFSANCSALTERLAAAGGLPEARRNELARAAASLIGLAKAALDGIPVSVSQGREVRERMIAAAASAPEGLAGEAAVEVITLAAAVLTALLERCERPKELSSSPDELKALGTVFAARFLTKGRVELGLVRENEAFLATSGNVRVVEERVNALYRQSGRDPIVLPIMFRSHGMSGAELRINAAKFVASMAEMETIFEAIGYECAICYGSLLGAVRDGDFIPHDDDVDMAIVMKAPPGAPPREELTQIAARLAEKKITARLAANHDFLKVKSPRGGKFVDVFPILDKDEATVRMYMEQLEIRDVPRALVLPFGELTFYDTRFKRPANPAGFLADRYGADWKTPKRQIGSAMLEV